MFTAVLALSSPPLGHSFGGFEENPFGLQSLKAKVESNPSPRLEINPLEKEYYQTSISLVKNPFVKSIKALTVFLMAQSVLAPVSASYVFEGKEEIGKKLASYFSKNEDKFPNIIVHPSEIHRIDEKYSIQLRERKGLYVTFKEDLPVYDGYGEGMCYNLNRLFSDLECGERLSMDVLTAHKNVTFLAPVTDTYTALIPFTSLEVNIEFTPIRSNRPYMCSIAKKARFFFTLRFVGSV